MSWYTTVLLILFSAYSLGLFYQFFFENKDKHRVNVMRHRMMLAERDSLIRRMNYAS